MALLGRSAPPCERFILPVSSFEPESVKVGRLRRVPAACLPEYVATLRGARKADGSAV
jgi:hypothetical protein